MVVIAPVCVLVMALVLGLATDVGHIVVEKANMQKGCDAAALAGAQVLLKAKIGGASEEEARALALAEATAIFQENSSTGGIAVEFGEQADDGAFVLAADTAFANRVRARGYRNSDAPGGALPLLFAQLFRVNACEVSAKAMAEFNPNVAGVLAGLSPFAIPQDRVPPPGDDMVFYPADPDAYDEGRGADKVVAGNWGLLNLDGGNLGTPELIDWILNGYDGQIVVDPAVGHLWIDGDAGFRSALQKTLEKKIGKPMIVLIFDDVTGTGAGASYRIVGFMRLTIQTVKLVGKDPYVKGKVEKVSTVHNLLTDDDAPPSVNMQKVQLIE